MDINQCMDGIYHIKDAMGVCMTLVCGSDAAVLIDTGYGLENVREAIRKITQKPLTVMLTHGHHDHVLGAQWFKRVHLNEADVAEFAQLTSPDMRRQIVQQAAAKGINFDQEAYVASAMAQLGNLTTSEFDLGGITLMAIHCPGHTPGSVVFYVKERQLLVTGDNWNPTTWLFFESALPVHDYLKNVKSLWSLPFVHVLCSHQSKLYSRQEMMDYFACITPEAIRSARRVMIAPYEQIDTRQIDISPNQCLIFDAKKAGID